MAAGPGHIYAGRTWLQPGAGRLGGHSRVILGSSQGGLVALGGPPPLVGRAGLQPHPGQPPHALPCPGWRLAPRACLVCSQGGRRTPVSSHPGLTCPWHPRTGTLVASALAQSGVSRCPRPWCPHPAQPASPTPAPVPPGRVHNCAQPCPFWPQRRSRLT